MLLGCSSSQDQAPPQELPPRHPAWRRARVLVADAVDPTVSVIDVDTADVTGLDLPGPVRQLASTRSGDHVVAVLETGEAHFLYAGVAIVAHLDGVWADSPHIHISKFPAQVLDFSIEETGGAVAVASNVPWLTVHRARDGEADEAHAFPEADLFQGGTPEPVVLESAAGPGVLVPVGEETLMLGAEGGGTYHSPTGAEIGTWSGCADQAGHVVRGHLDIESRVALGCSGGVLIAEAGEPLPSARLIAYPDSSARVTVLDSHADNGLVVGNYGAARLLVIDVSSDEARVLEPEAGEICDFAIEPAWGEHVVALSVDGVLRQLDWTTGATVKQLDVSEGFACSDEVRPHLAVSPMQAFVSVPELGAVREIDLRNLALAATHEVGGAPSSLAVAGVDDRSRNTGTGGHGD